MMNIILKRTLNDALATNQIQLFGQNDTYRTTHLPFLRKQNPNIPQKTEKLPIPTFFHYKSMETLNCHSNESSWTLKINHLLELMFMKHYAPNRCLYIKVAILRTGVGSAEMSHLQNCSVKIFKEHCRYFTIQK